MKKAMAMAMAAAAVAWGTAQGARLRVSADGSWVGATIATEPAAPLVWEFDGQLHDGLSGGAWQEAGTVFPVYLYDAAEGGNVLWGRVAPMAVDADGNFSVRLSDALPVADGAPTNTLAGVLNAGAGWLEIKALDPGTGNEKAVLPRVAVGSAPYALFANAATGARGDFDANGSLAVSGATAADEFSARGALAEAGVSTTGALSVGGDLTAGAGLKAASLTGAGAVPVGTIILWYGTEAPDGWAICNGENGTPNLAGKFPVGAGNAYAPGAEGGADTVTLETKHLPAHGHGYELRAGNNRDAASGADRNDSVWHGDSTKETGATGGGGAHENLPPFRALHYIMRVR
jgi:microcystin-dependent protein